MKILMISSYYLPYLAGAELYVKEIAERLVKNGNKAAVLTKNLGNLKAFEVINDVKVYRVFSGNTSHLRSVIAFPKMFFNGLKMAKECSLIHAHITYPNGIIAYLIARSRKKPYIITLQGDELMDYPEKRMLRMLKLPIGAALRNADKVHCISKALADAAVKNFGVAKDKTVIIPNGVDLAGFKNAKKIDLKKKYDAKKILISVSRLTDKNNIELVIRAMKHVDRQAKLIIIGDGPNKQKLLKLKKDLKVRVEFLGNIEHDRIAGYLKGADLFVRTPKTEGLGIVFLEAMAAGLPIITSNVGGIPDIVKHNETGIITGNKDEKELAKAINSLLKDKKLSEKLMINGKEFIRDYDWGIIYKKTYQMYSELEQLS